MKWIDFLRKYGPIPQNDNMFDETIQRSARRYKIKPILFEHPYQQIIIDNFRSLNPVSVILTGTAGDGKTHLCRQVWESLNGGFDGWDSDDPYLALEFKGKTLHFIRDLSGWAPQQGMSWSDFPEKELIIKTFCESIFDGNSKDIFLVAANDGQLIESFKRLGSGAVIVQQTLEKLLVEDRDSLNGVSLKMYNLSRSSSAELFERALIAFIKHDGWNECKEGKSCNDATLCHKCPIKHNYDLLDKPLVRKRLISLFELCDYNSLHLPIRQILLLLTNAVLGHPEAKDGVMRLADVSKVIHNEQVYLGSLYSNIFGGNLKPRRRESITVFNYLNRYQIGYETSNKIDNILIFGKEDPALSHAYQLLVDEDEFYGMNKAFNSARLQYLEGADEDESSSENFLKLLVTQRRSLFFKVSDELVDRFRLWELTVFKFAGEYIDELITPLAEERRIAPKIVARLVKGMNRIFTGMLIKDDHYVYLATSGSYSQAKVSRIFLDKISVAKSKGEKVLIEFDQQSRKPYLVVYFSNEVSERFELNLVRYEFLSRISQDGALPASFSNECYEDFLSFKSKLIAKYTTYTDDGFEDDTINLRVLCLTEQGRTEERQIVVTP